MGQKGSLDENAVHLVVTVLSSPELTLLPTILPHSFLQRYLRVSLMPNARNIKDGKHHVTWKDIVHLSADNPVSGFYSIQYIR